MKGFLRQVLPCEQAVCGSVAPLSREKGRCDGGLHCAVRGTSPERTDYSGKMVWDWENRNIPLVFFGKNDADCRFSPMLCPHFLFFL